MPRLEEGGGVIALSLKAPRGVLAKEEERMKRRIYLFVEDKFSNVAKV